MTAPTNPLIFSYTHEDQATQQALAELIRKLNESFPNTPAAIGTGNGEVQRGNIVLSAGITYVLNCNPDLVSQLGYPITPLQSELLLQQGRRPKEPGKYWEDLALILYSPNGVNGAHALALADEITRNKEILGLTQDQLRQPLLIARPGITLDDNLRYRFTVIPGVTQVSTPRVLQIARGTHGFRGFGLDHGLPRAKDVDVDDPNRYLWVPTSSNATGLRVFFRGRSQGLDARVEVLSVSYWNGRVTLSGR